MKRAVIYARYSTDNQSHETIEVQVERCVEYAKQKGFNIIEVFADEAVSGMKTNRPELQKLFGMAELGAFEVVLIYDQSRFSRDIVDWFSFRRTMQNHDIQIISVTQPYVGGDLNDTAVFATEGINALVNQIHVLQTRQKVVDAMNRIARQGLVCGGAVLLGYDVNDKRYVINEYEAEAVRLIFTLYAAGKSYKYLIQTLNEKGYKTKAGRTFGSNSINALLHNERYIGIYVYNKMLPARNGKRNSHKANPAAIKIPGAVPQIISNDLWDKVQDRLRSNKVNARNKAKVDYLLSGKLFCGECGMAMTGTRSNGKYYYYDCSGKKRLKNCDKAPIQKDRVEQMVINYVKETLVTNNQRHEIAQKLFEAQGKLLGSAAGVRIEIEKRIKEIDHQLENINNAIAQGIFSGSTMDKLTKLETEQRKLYTQLAATDKTEVSAHKSLDEILQILEYIANVPVDDLEGKQTLLAFVYRVFVYDDKIRIITNPLDENTDNVKQDDLPFSEGVASPAPSENPHES